MARQGEIDRCLNVIMSVDGQISREEAKTLLKLARQIPSGRVIVEIGAYRGRSTIALAFGSSLGEVNRVYAVDPHVPFQGVLGGRFGPEDQEALYQNLVKSGMGKIVAVVSLSSKAVASCWSERNIGLLWIDGNHTYEAVCEDYESWEPLIAEDGIVAFHDTTVPGVQKFISEMRQLKKLCFLGQTESLSWFRPVRE